jgi:hypothetical protein
MQPTGSNSSSSWDKKKNCPRYQKVSQIKIKVSLHFHDGCNAAAFYADMEQTFLESYSQDHFFQISVQGVRTATWRLQGSLRMKEDVLLRNARLRVRNANRHSFGQWPTPWSSRCQVTKILSSRTFVSSPLSIMSPIGIATVVLPNRKTDNKAGGSGAAGHWQWSFQLHGPADAR